MILKDLKERKLSKKKLIILIAIIVSLLLIAIFSFLYFRVEPIRIFFDKYLFKKNVTEGTLPSIATETSNVYVFNHNVIEQYENTLTFYNKNGEREDSLDIKIVNPIFSTNGNYLVMAEKNGQKLYLISNKNIVWEKDVEGNVSDVYVNKNGYVSVAITGTTYKTIVRMFSQDGSELFKRFLSNTSVMDLAISSDNKYLALAEVDSSGAVIKSTIEVIDINNAIKQGSDAIAYKESSPSNNLIVNIDYTKGNILSCIYDTHISAIHNNTSSEITNFNNSNIVFADLNDKIIQIEKKNTSMFNSTFELQIINPETSERNCYTLDKEPKSIETFGNVIAINFGTEALFINNNSWLIKQYTSYQEIQDISLSNNLAIIIFKNKTEIISL